MSSSEINEPLSSTSPCSGDQRQFLEGSSGQQQCMDIHVWTHREHGPKLAQYTQHPLLEPTQPYTLFEEETVALSHFTNHYMYIWGKSTQFLAFLLVSVWPILNWEVQIRRFPPMPLPQLGWVVELAVSGLWPAFVIGVRCAASCFPAHCLKCFGEKGNDQMKEKSRLTNIPNAFLMGHWIWACNT